MSTYFYSSSFLLPKKMKNEELENNSLKIISYE